MMNGPRRLWMLLVCLAAPSLLAAAQASMVSVDVGSARGNPGDSVTVEVTLSTGGVEVAGVQNDITFEPRIVAPAGCTVNPDLGKDLTQFGFSVAGLRAIVVGNNVAPIPDGSVLYTCTFDILAGAPPGADSPLFNSHIVASSPTGEQLPVAGSDGAIIVAGGRPTRTPTPTPTPVLPAVVLSSIQGEPGQRVPIAATLRSAGTAVGGVQNDIVLDAPYTAIAARGDGTPNCSVGPDLPGVSASFSFLPEACAGDACSGVRARVQSSTADPIPNGFTLYTCEVDISPDATVGEYPMRNSGVMLTAASGEPIDGAVGIDGTVFVLPLPPTATPPRPSIILTSAGAEPGDVLFLTATLTTAGASVAGTQNDIDFDSLNAPIVVGADGTPNCAANPAIDKSATSFAFRPVGCAKTGCTTVRALVFSISDTRPIPDGSVLYTCRIAVAPTAATGTYAFHVSGVVLSTPEGQAVPGAVGTDGVVVVGNPYGGPHGPPVDVAPTASATVTAAPTSSPRAAASPTATGTPRRAGDDGCEIETTSRPLALVLVIPAVMLLVRRRARRCR